MIRRGDVPVRHRVRRARPPPPVARSTSGKIVRDVVAARFKERGVKMAFITKIIGYELRCADPIAFDVQYTRTLGYGAVEFLANGLGQRPHLAAGGQARPHPLRRAAGPGHGQGPGAQGRRRRGHVAGGAGPAGPAAAGRPRGRGARGAGRRVQGGRRPPWPPASATWSESTASWRLPSSTGRRPGGVSRDSSCTARSWARWRSTAVAWAAPPAAPVDLLGHAGRLHLGQPEGGAARAHRRRPQQRALGRPLRRSADAGTSKRRSSPVESSTGGLASRCWWTPTSAGAAARASASHWSRMGLGLTAPPPPGWISKWTWGGPPAALPVSPLKPDHLALLDRCRRSTGRAANPSRWVM